MGYTVFHAAEREFRAPKKGDQRRGLVPLSDALQHMRANLWRLPPGARGARHLERVQEEMFIAVEGNAVMLLGDPPERIELAPGSIAVVEPGTPLQLRNESTEEIVVLIVGSPPEQGKAEYLPDVD
jgi:mannose-6-phosphate isomerase-like protein (cupin superfamily)